MKFTQIPSSTFQQLQLNAGIIASDFTPSTGTITESDIIAATTGGITFTATPTFSDWGEDIDNCPKNTMELKKIEAWDVKMSGTAVTLDTTPAKKLMAAADIDGTDTTLVTPRNDLDEDDFDDLWWIGDYSDENNDTSGGYIAIHMMNALSTGGFQIKSTDKAKGQFAFEYTAHYSIEAQDTVPFAVYIKDGVATGTTTTTNTNTTSSP